MAMINSKIERVYVEKPRADPEVQLSYIISTMSMTALLRTTVDMNIPQLLMESPKTVDELALLTNVQAPFLYRLLRGLSAIGYYSYDSESKHWINTKKSELFVGDYKLILDMLVTPLTRSFCKHVPQGLCEERNLFEIACNKAFDFASSEFIVAYHTLMESWTKVLMKTLVGHLDLSEYTSLLDIGGGVGTLLEFIHRENPHLKLGVFDLSVNKEKAIERFQNLKIDNFEFIEGNFFESITSGYDVYTMKNVIHDWNNEQALAILKNVRKAISDSGMLVVLDFCLTNEDRLGKFSKADDVLMMIAHNAESRTEKEFIELFGQADFRLRKIKYDVERISILYFVPV